MAGTSSCMGCGNPTLDVYICDKCGNEYCKDCYDEEEEMCLKCVQEQ